MNSPLMPKINERQFVKDLEKCKRISEAPKFKDVFCGDILLLDSESLIQTKILGGTTISAIEEIQACEWTLDHINKFCCVVKEYETGEEMVLLSQIRKPTRQEYQKMRSRYRFVPPKTRIVDIVMFWREKISGISLPFIQNMRCLTLKDGNVDGKSVIFLDADARFVKHKNAKNIDTSDWGYAETIQRYIELIPDISSEYFVQNKVEDITFWIPICRKSTKTAFRHRDKTGERREPLVHEVKKFKRKGEIDVDAHARGSGEFFLNGEQFNIVCGAETISRIFDTSSEKGRLRFLGQIKTNTKW